MIPNWNIICEGPSAVAATQADMLDGPTVAVNMAIRACHQGIQVDCWAMEDDPRLLWKYVQDCLPQFKMVWGALDFREVWESFGYKPDHLFLWEQTRTMGKTDKGDDMVLPTVFIALMKAKVHGAERIRLFGADMEGSGSPYTSWRPWAEDACGLAHRWENERLVLARAYRRLRGDGCRLERWKPEVVLS